MTTSKPSGTLNAMTCCGCRNESAYRISFSRHGEVCDECGRESISRFRFSDVYFKDGYFDEHIAHPEESPKGNYIRSREHKSALMRSLGISEIGDKVHGSRDQY